jgi:hypothetical protein
MQAKAQPSLVQVQAGEEQFKTLVNHLPEKQSMASGADCPM